MRKIFFNSLFWKENLFSKKSNKELSIHLHPSDKNFTILIIENKLDGLSKTTFVMRSDFDTKFWKTDIPLRARFICFITEYSSAVTAPSQTFWEQTSRKFLKRPDSFWNVLTNMSKWYNFSKRPNTFRFFHGNKTVY